METPLFPECQDGPNLSTFPLDGWMQEALKSHPSDCEALARIGDLQARRESFCCLEDYRDRGEEIIPLMLERARKAVSLGETDIGGIRLIGSIWLDESKGKVHKMANETACFYVYVLSMLDTDLAEYLACEGAIAKTLKKAGWRP